MTRPPGIDAIRASMFPRYRSAVDVIESGPEGGGGIQEAAIRRERMFCCMRCCAAGTRTAQKVRADGPCQEIAEVERSGGDGVQRRREGDRRWSACRWGWSSAMREKMLPRLDPGVPSVPRRVDVVVAAPPDGRKHHCQLTAASPLRRRRAERHAGSAVAISPLTAANGFRRSSLGTKV